MMNFWWIKILAKLLLSRLPFNYKFWSKIGLFRHGSMDDNSYVWNVLSTHVEFIKETNGWMGLELGPGDGILSALLAPAKGSSGLVLVDAGNFAHMDVKKYHKQIISFINDNKDKILPDYLKTTSINEMLNMAGAAYHSEGLISLRRLKSESFDLIYSQAVLEHIRLSEFKETMLECRRLLKPNGIMSHVVDYKDHLGGGLNNLRFPSSLWEKNWFAYKSGFYTNRLRMSEMISICEDIGLKVAKFYVRNWESLPINQNNLTKEFKTIPKKDLIISGAHLLMKNDK